MDQLNLTIDVTSKETIQNSFDRIAKDLILNWQLKINDMLFTFTEIEFYYYYEGIHEDIATHKHKYDKGQWRIHRQGLDITFQWSDISDGGILIRGLKSENGYINGPLRVLETIFKNFNPVIVIQQQFGLIPKLSGNSTEIFKTERHGLSTTLQNFYSDALYRYYVDLADWKNIHVSFSEKAKIKLKSLRFEI